MKVGVLMCAFREKSKILSAIQQFKGTPIKEIVVACSKAPWAGNLTPDETSRIALEAGVTVKFHSWEKEEDQKNWGMEMLTGMDWVLISAPDMYMSKESIYTMLDWLEHDAEDEDRAAGCAMKTYWKDLETIVKPDYPFNTCAIRPNERFEYSARLYDWTEFKQIPGVLMHHLSWVKTDEEMKTKIDSYTHAHEIDEHWYRDVWLGWHEGIENFHPTTPTDYERVVKYKLPDEIERILDPKWVKKFNNE